MEVTADYFGQVTYSLNLSRHEKDGAKEPLPVNERFKKEMDFKSYHLAHPSTHHHDPVGKHLQNMASRLQVRVKYQLFHPIDQILIIVFCPALQIASDNSGVHERVALWLLTFFMKKSAAKASKTHLSWKEKSSHGMVKQNILTSYVQFVNHVLETHFTEGIVKEADTEVLLSTQPTDVLR